ncbi:MAG: bifunctional adenosylcobinamide kinase/adenosylcobinamide-phosphate guanylyltransferase [Paenibacillaceae bacterium]
MLLVTGGAYAGKRKYIRELFHNRTLEWVSSYERHEPDQWRKQWTAHSILVMEGWEEWVQKKLLEGASEEEVQSWISAIMNDVFREEDKRTAVDDKGMRREVVFIMLEMGRGIVPISPEERAMRDIIGRIAQTAALASNEVIYMWHGLPRIIKSN